MTSTKNTQINEKRHQPTTPNSSKWFGCPPYCVAVYIYERWKKRPDQKGKQSIPSAGNQCRVPAGSVSATKKREYFWPKTRLPPNGFSIWPMENVQGGMPDRETKCAYNGVFGWCRFSLILMFLADVVFRFFIYKISVFCFSCVL